MKSIPLKFDIDDELWFMDNNQARRAKVKLIEITRVHRDSQPTPPENDCKVVTFVRYTVEGTDNNINRLHNKCIHECLCFPTKQALLESL